jgi:hypothetical protein
VARPSIRCESRNPGSTLYQIVRDHFETFRAQAASLLDGEGLPRFVEREFRDFLRCGWPAGVVEEPCRAQNISRSRFRTLTFGESLRLG